MSENIELAEKAFVLSEKMDRWGALTNELEAIYYQNKEIISLLTQIRDKGNLK